MFWNRKSEKPKPLDSPRPHHYLFAHRILRQACEDDLLQFFSVIASADQEEYLRWLWSFTEKHLGEKAVGLSPDQIKVTIGRVNDCPAVILEMPEPLAVAEAWMVGIILTGLKEGGRSENLGFRYFTLEYGFSVDNVERTVMCEWNNEAHLNFGDGPPPEVSQFVQAIEQKL